MASRAHPGALRRVDLSFDLQAPPSMMSAAARLAKDFPGTQIALTHLGLPLDRSVAGLRAWDRGMEQLAECANVSVKISGLPMCDWNWTPASLRPLVRRTLQLFGAERCMIGSNFPVDSLHASSYAALIAAYRGCLSDLSEREVHSVMHGTAERVYRI